MFTEKGWKGEFSSLISHAQNLKFSAHRSKTFWSGNRFSPIINHFTENVRGTNFISANERRCFCSCEEELLPKISTKSDSGFWIFQERKQKGEYHLLLQDLRLHDHEYFFKCFRMSHSKYEELLRLVAPFIRKCSLKWKSIGPSERLSVTLRYLANRAGFIGRKPWLILCCDSCLWTDIRLYRLLCYENNY